MPSPGPSSTLDVCQRRSATPRADFNTADVEPWVNGIPPGSPALDAPLGDGWLLNSLGDDFALLSYGWEGPVPERVSIVSVGTRDAILLDRFGLEPGSAYLIRPDQYVAARWKSAEPLAIKAALRKAQGKT